MHQKNIFSINPETEAEGKLKLHSNSSGNFTENKPNHFNYLNQEFEIIWNNPAIGLRVFQTDGKTIKINKKLVELLGFEEEEILTKTDNDLLLSAQQKEVSESLKEFLNSSHKSKHLEKTLLTAEAGAMSFDAYWFKITDDGDSVNHILELLVPLKTDLYAEPITKYQKDFLRTLIDSIPNAIFYKNTDGLFLGCNKKFEVMFNEKIDEIFGKTVFDVFQKNLAEHEANTDKEILRSGKDLFYECEINDSQGAENKNIKVNKSIFHDSNGNIAGVICVIEEIVNVKSINEKAKHQKINESGNHNKDKIFSILSHDLRNPFTTLMGFSDLLVDEFDNFSNEEKKSYLAEIQKSVKNAYENLNDLILWTKSQVDSVSAKTEMMDLTFTIDEVVNELSLIAKAKDIIVENRIPEHVNVFVDKSILTKVVREILDNAIKFSYPRSRVLIKAKFQEDNVELTIEDHGIGMNEEELKRLFKPDEQIIKYGTNKERGSGLGLILCNEIITKINGKIFIESEKDVRTKVYIVFPKSIV